MDRYRIRAGACVLALAALLSGCPSSRRPAEDVTVIEPPLSEPAVPAGYQKIAPAPLDGPELMLAQTASVFTGTLKDVKFTYDDCAGPRIHYVFSDSTTLMGTQLESQVAVKVLGGPTPHGTWVEVSELPRLALDSQYVVFLRNTDWTFSPVVGNLVFRREILDGREVLVDVMGRAVTGWGDDGPLLSAGSVSEPVGRRLGRYRSPEQPAQTAGPNSAATDSRPEVRPADGNPPAPAQPRTDGSVLARAPSLDEARRAGLFARPALSNAALANEPAVSAESFVAAVRAAADRAHVNIGGRATLDPYWRCWVSTPTSRATR
jgi:hypothetical protein